MHRPPPRDRSPIPPPREPKRDPYAMQRGDRRRRSMSPPPPHPERVYKRHRRDDEYYDRHDRYGSPRHRGRSPDYGRGGYDDYDPYYGGAPHHHQPPPPPKRAEGRGGASGGSSSNAPLSFKRYMLEKVAENVTPQQAQVMYEAYLTEHFGDQLRAKFEQEKANDEVRAAFHPSAFESSLTRHKEEAAATAALLAVEVSEGKYDPALPGFHQGLLESGGEGAEEGAAAGPKPPEGPVCLWKPDRVAQDYKIAKQLVAVVDHQRGLKLADNPLLPQVAAAAEAGADGAVADGQEANGGKDAAGGNAGSGGGAPAAAGGEAGGADASEAGVLRAVLAEIDAEDVVCDDEPALQDRLGQLDQLLTWLWRVHGVDYYGGRELLRESEYMERASLARTIRGPRPEEGEEQDEEEAKSDRAELAERVDKVWAARLEQPDPLVQGCQQEEIERRLNDYVESQIKQEGEKKWGSAFSNKFFLEKRFVVKHIFNKHQGKLDEQRNVIREELYWQAYETAKKSQHAAQRAATKEREAQAVAAAAAAAADVHMGEAAAEWHEGAEGEEGAVGGRGGGRGGAMRGRGGRGAPLGAGRGGRGGPMMPMMGELPVVDPTQMMMMGGLPGPIILPGPGMMGALPGGIPLGAPMMLDPALMGGEIPMPLFIPPQGAGRGAMRGGMMGARGRGGRGMGGRGFGPGMAAPPGTKLEGPGYLKHYYDLDAPANNRAVLDYGDL